MRRFALVLLSLVATACSSLQGLLEPVNALNAVPVEIQLGGTETQFNLRAGPNVAWKLDSPTGWIVLSPESGLGPATIRVRTNFSEPIAEQAEYQGLIEVSGDLKGFIRVRLPLVRVTGQVEATPAATALASAPGLGWQGLRPEAGGDTGEVLVKYRQGGLSRQSLGNARMLDQDSRNRLAKLKTADVRRTLEQLRADPNVVWAEPNGIVSALGAPGQVQAQAQPTDQFLNQQWYFRQTGAHFGSEQAYARPVTVAVIDTGVRYDHPDLAGRLWQPGEGAYDFVGDTAEPCAVPDPLNAPPTDNNPQDPCDALAKSGGSHGTHVTGIIVANAGTFDRPCPTCTDSGMVGLGYRAQVKVLPIRVLDAQGNGSFANVALAVRYAGGIAVTVGGQTLLNPRPAQIINLSLGARSGTQAFSMCEAIADVTARGVVVVAAAGNFQSRFPGDKVYPASCPGVVSVAATDDQNQSTFYSQQNEDVDVTAPGGNTTSKPGGVGGILSTTWNYTTNLPNYTFYMGTSQASPQVAAAVAMVLSADKAETPRAAWELVKSRLTDLGTVGRDNIYGDGFLNLPGVFGWVLPSGNFLVQFSGPSPRLKPITGSSFETRLMPGIYKMQLCRDDSANQLCDPGEPASLRDLTVPRTDALDLGTMRLGQ
ncbi:MAG: S8 family serine peptidase [Meiothermus sp.]|nr:S8 family serine peptidase [Meiothermus sp.]